MRLPPGLRPQTASAEKDAHQWRFTYADTPEGEYPEVYDFMGLTWEEYAFVLTDERRLNAVVEAHRVGQSLATYLASLDK